jgi:uncharacterized protein (TIGR03435 family)
VNRLRLCLWAGLLATGSLVVAQDRPARLTFDVATIRPSDPAMQNGGIKPLPGGNGYMTQNVPVKLMISLMYEVPMRQIIGCPDWLNTDRYDIEAKADGSYSKDDLHLMFQSLLADRFNLKFHKETKEGPVYALTVDKAGSKMTANTSEQDYKIPMIPGPDGMKGKRVSMKYLSWYLGQQVQRDERPVVDKTGLTGNYDFTLNFAPYRGVDAPADVPDVQNRPSLFEALKEQLGLRLTSEKGPVEYYVIDHIDRPSDN